MSTAKNTVFISMTLDGCIARADGSIDFLDAFQIGEEDYGFHAFFADVDTLVIGRGTYDTVIGFPEWPYAGKRVIVLTHRPPTTAKADEEFFAGDVVELGARLKREGRRVYVDGGNVIQQFLDADLVDSLIVSVLPVLIGGGRRLFGDGREHRLQLVETKPYATGLVQLRYAPAAT